MSVVVEHDKRKKMILEKALDLFIEEGYEDVTYHKIAERCGITRSTLYIYFKNKREIFMFSLKQLTDSVENLINSTIQQTDLSYSEKLKKILMEIEQCCIEKRKLFNVVLTYLLQIQKTGADTSEKIERRIIKMRHLISSILIDGINSGEFKKIDIRATNEIFYSIIESEVIKLSIFNKTDVACFERVVNLLIKGIKAQQ